MSSPEIVGTEWLVEAEGCASGRLREPAVLKRVFANIIEDLGLKPIGEPIWHKFPGEGGVTGLVALTESHLACHTYPEHRIATFNLYCCRARPEWDWAGRLGELLDAKNVTVTKLERGGVSRAETAGGGA
jgi:S-adenosylmethionine decarboxylase